MKELPESAKAKIESTGEINLNAGSGTHPKPGFISYDINDQLPDLDICDDLWNVEQYFEQESLSNVMCLEVLEHFKRD